MHPRLAPLIAQLAERRMRLLAELGRRDAEVLALQPAPGAWSLLQVAQHLQLVEEGMLRQVQDPRHGSRALRRRPKNRLGYVIMNLVLATGARVRVPRKVHERVAPPESGDLDSLAARWEQSSRQLEDHFHRYTEADFRRLVALHPIGGPLTPVQLLLFLRRHFDHHLRQVARIDSQVARLAAGARETRHESRAR